MAQLLTQSAPSALEPWHIMSHGEIAGAVVALVDKYAGDQRHRRTRLLKWLSAYHGREMRQLVDEFFDYDPVRDTGEALTPSKSCVNAAVAKICARQRPKGQWLTKGADYRHRVQAKYRSRFCEGLLYQRQGRYANSWELMEAAFRDACVGEAGCVVVERDKSLKVARHSRAMSWEFFFDPEESEAGNPRSMFRRHKVNKFGLAEQFKTRKADIMAAGLHQDDQVYAVSGGDKSAMCSLYHAWHLPIPDGEGGWKGGRHILTVAGAEKPLVDEPWHWPNFHVLFMTFTPNRTGMMGEPLVERTMRMQRSANDTFNRIDRNVRLLANGWIDYVKDTYDKKALESNDAMKLLERQNPGAPQATVTLPQPFNAATLNWLDWKWSKCFELAQISELNSSSRMETGVTAAVAMRTKNDLQSELFLPQSRAYEQAFATLAIMDVQCARDMADEGVNMSAAFNQHGVMKMIDWDTIQEEDDDLFEVTPVATSAEEDSLAGRRQTITELAQSGAMTPETAARLLTEPNPDLPAYSKRAEAQARYIEGIIEEMLEAFEDDDEPYALHPLDPHLDLDPAIMQVTDAYVEALADRVPEYNLDLMRAWIEMADKEVARRTAPPPSNGVVVGGAAVPTPGATDAFMGGMPAEMAPPPEMQGPPPGAPVQ